MIEYMRLPENILAGIPSLQRFLMQEKNIVSGYLFGGVARGEVSLFSDVDIAVSVRDASFLPEYKLEICCSLTETLQTDEIDLVIFSTAPVILSGMIIRSRHLLVDTNPPLRHVYESLTLRKFFDFTLKTNAIWSRRYGIG